MPTYASRAVGAFAPSSLGSRNGAVVQNLKLIKLPETLTAVFETEENM